MQPLLIILSSSCTGTWVVLACCIMLYPVSIRNSLIDIYSFPSFFSTPQIWELWSVYPIRWGQCAVPGFDSAQLSQVTLGMITLASKRWRNHISFVCTERVWRGHSTSSCVRHVASTVAMWQRLWRPMTWCPGSSSHMPRLLSSILAHRSLRCHPAFCWRWRKTALRASMPPWNNVHWSPNQFLCFNYHTNTYSDTCKWLHKADDMICQITL
jgi:hypothetical protein